MRILADIRKAKLTLPGIREIVLDKKTFLSVVSALRGIQRYGMAGPGGDGIQRYFVDDIEIKQQREVKE